MEWTGHFGQGIQPLWTEFGGDLLVAEQTAHARTTNGYQSSLLQEPAAGRAMGTGW